MDKATMVALIVAIRTADHVTSNLTPGLIDAHIAAAELIWARIVETNV